MYFLIPFLFVLVWSSNFNFLQVFFIVVHHCFHYFLHVIPCSKHYRLFWEKKDMLILYERLFSDCINKIKKIKIKFDSFAACLLFKRRINLQFSISILFSYIWFLLLFYFFFRSQVSFVLCVSPWILRGREWRSPKNLRRDKALGWLDFGH